MVQTQTDELRISFSTDSGKNVAVTIPDIDCDTVTSDTAIAILNASKQTLTADSDSTIVQSTDGGNVLGIRYAKVVRTVETTLIDNTGE